MPALRLTGFTARITFLGLNPDRGATLRNAAVDRVDVTFEGFRGESHAGLTRPSCSRVIELYARGTEIRNTRQITILSGENLTKIAAIMDIPALDPTWIAANMVVEGIPDLSHLPPGARLLADNGTSITVDLANGPCHLPAPIINEDAPGKGGAFKTAAKGLRGVTAWVERPGALSLGDTLRLFVPDQTEWRP